MSAARVMLVSESNELVWFDLEARLEHACELIVDAGVAGAEWILFPEAYLPGGPEWLWSLQNSGGPDRLQSLADHTALIIPGAVSERLCRVAQRSRVHVAIGLIERDGDTSYSSLIMIDANGQMIGHYRNPLQASTQHGWIRITNSIVMQIEQKEWAGGI